MRRQDAVALLLVALFAVALYWPGLSQGRVRQLEDILGQYYPLKAQMRALATGQQPASWWNPLPGLGVPRLSNVQAGYASLSSPLFYGLDTPRALALYPALVLVALAGASYWLFRERGLAVAPSLFGGLAWATMGGLLESVQHPPVVDSLVAMPVFLACWERFARTGSGRWAAAGGVAVAFMVLGGSPQYVLYGALTSAVWIGLRLAEHAGSVRRLLPGTILAAAAGALIGMFVLLPAAELAARSQRSLMDEAFSESFRSAPGEVLLALAAEAYLVFEPPPLQHGRGYPNRPELSALVPLLALLGLARGPRPVGLWLYVGVCLLGMLGRAGGVTILLGEVLPFGGLMRAPSRFLVPAAFVLCYLAAAALERRARWAAPLALALLAASVWGVQRPRMEYFDPAILQPPPPFRTARARLATNVVDPERCPPESLGFALSAGVPALVVMDPLVPANYFEAMFASQIGALDENQEKVFHASSIANIFPVMHPAGPMARALGLSTWVTFAEGAYRFRSIDSPGRFYLVPEGRVLSGDAERWAFAAAQDWDPRQVAGVDRPVPAGGGGTVTVVRDDPDRQVVRTAGGGGLVVSAANRFPGWEARLDGRPAEIVEANLALMGVAVPPGEHTVEWSYRPTWLPLAVACGLAGIAILGYLGRS